MKTIILCLALLVCYLPPALPQDRPSSGVHLYSELESRVLPNNTILSPGDIGTSVTGAVLCSTASNGNDHGGRWRDPNGDELETSVVDDALYSLIQLGLVSLIRGTAVFDSAGVEGVYRCRIRDETNTFRNLYAGIYRTSSLENSNGPVVQDPIAFTLLTDLSSPTSSFSLNCTSQSFPPTELSWSRNGQPLPLSGPTYQSSQQLRDVLSTTYDNLLTVNDRLPGLYNCTATNERGSQSATLDVTMPSGPPTNLRATIQGRNQVRVSWTASGNALGYLILHRLGGGSESQVNVEDSSATEQTIELTGEGKHTITMLAYALLPNPTRSEPAVVNLNLPDPLTNTQVSPVDPTGLRVSWTPPPDNGLEGFRISYTPISGDCPGILGGSMEVDGGGVREGTVGGLVGATQYSVTVSARNDMGYGPPSAGVLETTAEAAPSAPPLSVVPTAEDASTIRITWEPPACETWNSEAITSYVIRNVLTDPILVEDPALRSVTIPNLPTFTEYRVEMAAVNSVGQGPFSNSTTITLADGQVRSLPSTPSVPGQVQSLSSSPDILSASDPTSITTTSNIVDNGSGDPTSSTTVAESPSNGPTGGTSSSSVGLAAGAAVAGVAVLIILTVAVVVLVVRLWRQRQKYKFCEKVKAESPLQLSVVSPLPNEAIYHDAKYDEIVGSSTQQGDAAYATVGNTSYEAPSPGYSYVHPSGANSEVTGAKRSQVTGSTLVENQHYACQKKDQLTAPTIEPYQEELQVSEGERVTLMAGASGSPQPTITWVYMGREVEADCATKLGEDGSLTLLCAEPKHAGTYHFTASNEAGSVEGSVTLIICADEEQGEGGTGLATVESSPLEVEWFGEGVSHLHACNNAGFILQYQSLPCGEVEKNLTIGTLPLNQLRNRFNNIIAYDSYRIVLEPVPNLEHDYINASYIDGHSKPKKYIATQAPLPNTVADFWRLVWQENVQAIAMLTNITEGYQKKCEQYWPQSKQSEEYWPFEVTVVDQMVFADYTVRTMQLEQSGMVGVRKKVVHFHFTSWPDHGVPEYAGPLLVYLRRIKAKYKLSKGPLLVHCSAGVGRTGTLIAIDTALEQAAKEGMVDIVAIVCRMRDQRMKMVQTAEQYVFIHDAILESLVCGDTLIPSFELRKTTERLSVKDELSGKTGFEMQLHVLDQVTPNPNEVVRSAALNNREKNRNMDFLPPDNWRVVLKAVTENYIHASYANGYKQNKRFIIAQPPMRSTVCDFWKMAYERECGVIVMLSDNIEDRKEVCFPYWPKANKIDLKYGGYAVSTSEFHEQDGYTRRTFTITGPQSDEVHKVTQFQMTGWSSEGLCTDHKALIVIVGEVTTEQMRTGNKPIVVHGSDTVSRSGIFCAFMNAMECCKAEGTVDVFQVVRALRIQKPGAVPTVEQYCSIFDLMFLFLDKFDVYSNFK